MRLPWWWNVWRWNVWRWKARRGRRESCCRAVFVGNCHQAMTRRAHRLLPGQRSIDLKTRAAMRTRHRQQGVRFRSRVARPFVGEAVESARRFAAAVEALEHAAAFRRAEIVVLDTLDGRFATDRRAERIDRHGDQAVAHRAHRLAARHRRIDLKHAIAIGASELQHRRSPECVELKSVKHRRPATTMTPPSVHVSLFSSASAFYSTTKWVCRGFDGPSVRRNRMARPAIQPQLAAAARPELRYAECR